MLEQKYKMLDLFAGCGGLMDGFLQSGYYKEVASVEWQRPQVNTLRNRLETKWGIKDAKERVMHFDMQKEQELFNGWEAHTIPLGARSGYYDEDGNPVGYEVDLDFIERSDYDEDEEDEEEE